MIASLYVSASEAAALMGCSVTTVMRGIAAGRIPCIRPGGPKGRPRIPRAWISSIGTTVDMYAKEADDARKRAAEAMDRAMERRLAK